MIRRISPRELKRLSKRLGLQIEELNGVREVRIIHEDRDIIISDPKVSILKVGNEQIFQVIGEAKEVTREVEVEISDEDVELVAMQAGVSREEALKALKQTGGDLAKAILLLSSSKTVG